LGRAGDGTWPAVAGVADNGEPVAAGARYWWPAAAGPTVTLAQRRPGLCLWCVWGLTDPFRAATLG